MKTISSDLQETFFKPFSLSLHKLRGLTQYLKFSDSGLNLYDMIM
jgi:hypothetical protein